MKTKMVESSQLFNEKRNPTLCLSTLRVFGRCFECPTYQNTNDIKKLKCKPKINKKHRLILQRIDVNNDLINMLNKKHDNLMKELG